MPLAALKGLATMRLKKSRSPGRPPSVPNACAPGAQQPAAAEAKPTLLARLRKSATGGAKQPGAQPVSPACNPLTKGLHNLSSTRAIARRSIQSGSSAGVEGDSTPHTVNDAARPHGARRDTAIDQNLHGSTMAAPAALLAPTLAPGQQRRPSGTLCMSSPFASAQAQLAAPENGHTTAFVSQGESQAFRRMRLSAGFKRSCSP